MALVLVAAAAARAEEPLRVSLDDALALLRRQSPELLSSALQVRAAQGDVVTARLLPNPVLSAGVGNFPIGQTNPPGIGVGDTVVSSVGVAQEVPLWGKRGARITSASEKAAATEAQRQDLDRQLAFEVRSRFSALLEASERLRLARENLDRYRETVRVTAARVHEGDVSPAEGDKVALEQRTFEHEVDDAELDRREAVGALLPLLGVTAYDVEPIGELAPVTAPEDVNALIADALDRRPDLQAAERAQASADAALRLARAQAWPNVTVGLQYTHSQFTVSGDLPNQFGTSLSVPLPVFDRNQGDIVRAESEAAIARHDADHLRLLIPQEVRAAVERYTISQARVRRYADGFLRQARGARQAAEASYREGAVSLLEFLEAERTFNQTERDHLDALHDENAAAAEITKAAALEVPR